MTRPTIGKFPHPPGFIGAPSPASFDRRLSRGSSERNFDAGDQARAVFERPAHGLNGADESVAVDEQRKESDAQRKRERDEPRIKARHGFVSDDRLAKRFSRDGHDEINPLLAKACSKRAIQ
jgi:hypothetical protein